MEKQLRSSLKSSAEEFLSTATKFALKSSKSVLKTLIHGVEESSELCSSLPHSLSSSISRSLQSFRGEKPNPSAATSPATPPAKRSRKSSRKSKIPRPDRDEDENTQRTLQSLHIFAYAARLCVSHPESAFSAEDLLPGARSLHDNLIGFDSDSALSSEIASLCEDWWKRDLAGRESLISQSLPLLLSRSLTSTKKQDVHRVYALREAFSLFDFEDESIDDLKLLIIRCVLAPLYMKTEEGRKFVAFAFGLSSQLLKELMAMIRSQIPLGGKSMLEAYGDVLFRAWKVAEESARDEIEDRFLQGLIEGAIHAGTDALSASVRRVLSAFVNQRTTNGVEKLLFRLSEPLIFRSLQVANSSVRKNALHLLLDLFPLEDPDSSKEVKDTLLGTQFYLVEKLLVDDHPDTRVVAVEGCCRVLYLFWEIIPSPTIPKILTKIFDDMSHDVSNEVRLSTLNGVIYLLGNPRSHEILKVLLPRLKHLILDKALAIRRAMLDLLLAIRDIQNFQFNKVVALDVLLEVLATDQTDVAQKITKLLMPSYFPSKASIEEACNRCFALIKRSPVAGARFCELAALEGASHKSLAELVKGLVGLVLSVDKLQIDYIEGLLLSAANVCNSLTSEPKYKNSLKEHFIGEKLKSLFDRATSKHSQSSIFKIASAISIDEVDALLDGCMSWVTNCIGLSEDVQRQSEVRSAHQLLASCSRLDCMVEVLMSLLQKTVYHCHLKYGTEVPKLSVTSAKRKKDGSSKISAKWKHIGGKKPTNFEEDYSVSVGIAWQIKELLQSEDTRKAVLESQNLESLFLALKVISEISILQCIHCEYMDVSPLLAYTALSLHMTLENISVRTKDGVKRKNNNSDSSDSNLNTVLEQTLVHVLNCTSQLFGAGKSKKSESKKSPPEPKQSKSGRRKKQKESDEPEASEQPLAGSLITEQQGLSNKVKMLTTVLQFITDSAEMDFAFHNHERYLKFTSEIIRHLGSTLSHLCSDQTRFDEDEDVKGSILCLKSLLTYAAKLLALALKDTTEDSPPPLPTFVLANDILSIITSVELCLGTGHAARIVGATKPWLPDLVLALGSCHILKQARGESAQRLSFGVIATHFPSWLSVSAKIELSKMSKIDGDDEDEEAAEEFPVSKKLAETILVLVKRNPVLVDAVGEIFLTASLVGLEGKDYGMALGLVHVVRAKLFRRDETEWGDSMMGSLKEIYPKIEKLIEEETDDDERQKLESARSLLDPVWTHHLYQTGNLFAESDE